MKKYWASLSNIQKSVRIGSVLSLLYFAGLPIYLTFLGDSLFSCKVGFIACLGAGIILSSFSALPIIFGIMVISVVVGLFLDHNGKK